MLVSLQVNPETTAATFARVADAFSPATSPAMASGMTQGLGVLMDWEQERYREFSTGAGDWPDLAYVTKRERLRRNNAFGGAKKARGMSGKAEYELIMDMQLPILIDTGRAYNSLQQGQPDNEIIVDQNSVTQQSVVPYLWKHMYGPMAQAGLPVRKPIVPPSREALAAAAIPIANGMRAAIAAAVA